MARPVAFRVSCAALLMAVCSLLAALKLCAQTAAVPTSPPAQAATAPGQAPANADAAQGVTTQLPAFDVVSIKTHEDEGMMMRFGTRFTPDGIQTDGFPLELLIRGAFGLSEDRILNEPDWVRSARFDINAKVAPEDAPKLKSLSMQQRSAMMLPVLEDRFGLKFHHETKVLQVYTLVVAKGGPKLKESEPDAGGTGAPVLPMKVGDGAWAGPPASHAAAGSKSGDAVAGKPEAGGGPGGNTPRTMMRVSTEGMTMDARGSTMASLAQLIEQQISATVIDKTGLTGKYDFTLSFMPDSFMMNGQMMRPSGGGSSPDGAQTQEPVGPSIFAAVQEQLGLKLVGEKQPVDVVVIDHIEQPTAN